MESAKTRAQSDSKSTYPVSSLSSLSLNDSVILKQGILVKGSRLGIVKFISPDGSKVKVKRNHQTSDLIWQSSLIWEKIDSKR